MPSRLMHVCLLTSHLPPSHPAVSTQVVEKDRHDPTKMRTYLTPCSPGDPAAQELSWMDVDSDMLLEPKVTRVCAGHPVFDHLV